MDDDEMVLTAASRGWAVSPHMLSNITNDLSFDRPESCQDNTKPDFPYRLLRSGVAYTRPTRLTTGVCTLADAG